MTRFFQGDRLIPGLIIESIPSQVSSPAPQFPNSLSTQAGFAAVVSSH